MKHINFKKIVIALGIVIVLNLFFNYGIDTFYKGPKYDNFCRPEALSKQYQTKGDCDGVGGLWTDNQNKPLYGENPAPVPVMEQKTEPLGWCDVEYTCRKDFESVQNLYNRNVFIILIIAGIVSIIIGFLIGQSEAVSSGLSFGGILSLIIGTIRYWSGMDDYLRFIILGAALAVLIWIGVKKLKDSHENDGI